MVDLTTLARRIAPLDLPPTAPLYLLLASQQPPEELANYPAPGATSHWLDLVARDWLKARGDWRGRGPTIWLNDVKIKAASVQDADGDSAFAEDLYRGRLTALLIHEVSHVLSKPIDVDDDFPEVAIPFLKATVSNPHPPQPQDALKPLPWIGHQCDFLRVLAHVVHRAEALLQDRLPDPWLLANRSYCVSPLFCYRDVLGDEPEDMAGASFSTIRDTPIPEPFLELWRDDAARYLRENKHLHFRSKTQ